MNKYEIYKIIGAIIHIEKTDQMLLYEADMYDVRYELSDAREILLRIVEEYTGIDDDCFYDEDYVEFIEEMYGGKYSPDEVLSELERMKDRMNGTYKYDNVIYLSHFQG